MTKRFLSVICMLLVISGLFGCNKKTEYPFDTEKAYCYSRRGVIAGGSFELKLEPEGLVEYYSYPKSTSASEGGMKDRGANIYFVGLKEGTVKVTAVFTYPTSKPSESTFTLNVDEDLRVTKVE